MLKLHRVHTLEQHIVQEVGQVHVEIRKVRRSCQGPVQDMQLEQYVNPNLSPDVETDEPLETPLSYRICVLKRPDVVIFETL